MNKNFLQSEEWRKFQESVGYKTYRIDSRKFYTSIIKHRLPIVGDYFYIPRGQVSNIKYQISSIKQGFENIINLAKKEKTGWVRIDLSNRKIHELIQELIQEFGLEIRKAPHDMQPRQVFIMDISKPEEELLTEMKSKTRYNIRLAQKRGVKVCHPELVSGTRANKEKILKPAYRTGSQAQDDVNYINEFLRLVKLTSKRKNITSHPDEYYRKMLKIPGVKLYVAEYEEKIIAANIIVFYGDTAIYLHGASDNKYRNAMAPFLLQWQAIKDAKKEECEFYDMGGVKISNSQFLISNKIPNSKFQIRNSNWAGITRFKLGFSPKNKPVEFLGSYDIVISSWKYWIYRIIQLVKGFAI